MSPLRGKARVLVTGAAGGIGRAFRAWAADRYEFVAFDRQFVEDCERPVVGELTDLDALLKAARGCAALVHLGARRDEDDFMSTMLPDNMLGTYCALEAARLAGIPRFVFASTVQVEARNRKLGQITDDMIPHPTNLYAVSKVVGEHLGEMYAAVHGLSVICLRLGWVALPRDLEEIRGSSPRGMAWVLTERDLCEILARAVEVPHEGFHVVPAYSRNAAGVRDLGGMKRILGYAPRDDAAELFGKSGGVS